MSIPRECNQRGPSYRHEHAEPRTRYPVTILMFFAPVRGPRIPGVALDPRERESRLSSAESCGRKNDGGYSKTFWASTRSTSFHKT